MSDTKIKTSPFAFIRQVRQEVSKITWPTRKETVTSAVMVLVIVFIAGAFFMLVDFVIVKAVQAFLGL
ncbi:MAG: preprotein translocase subunit SecE [Alphaproteobacteria bacterium]|nr:preprotein translocase subunit SecE [Alphaproteobacteria bacterium]